MLGGVPIGVPTPPKLAEYAIPRISATPNRGLSTALIMAIAIGNIMSIVAVLLIHILRTAVVNIKPSTSLRGLPLPVNRSMYMANRLCKLALSNAFDNIKAAISKIMTWLPNDDAASLCDSTPNKGNNAKGKREVAGIGSASVTHKMATNSVMAAVKNMSLGCPTAQSPRPLNTDRINAKRIMLFLRVGGLLGIAEGV